MKQRMLKGTVAKRCRTAYATANGRSIKSSHSATKVSHPQRQTTEEPTNWTNMDSKNKCYWCAIQNIRIIRKKIPSPNSILLIEEWIQVIQSRKLRMNEDN